MSGKTTNLLYIHRTLTDRYKGEMLVLDTEKERTLFFDFFPVSLGTVQGYSLKFHLYTIPGQIYYEASRRIILEGADGVVFVADSQTDKLDENIEMFGLMCENLRSHGIDPAVFPLVLQYNKRDCIPRLRLGVIEEKLDIEDIPVTESIATQGRGVMRTLQIISREIIKRFQVG
jgi:signal recognition particle receptor subunit beta